MTMSRQPLLFSLRGVLCAAFLAAVPSACTRTQVTEVECVPVPDERLSASEDTSDKTLVCSSRRVRLIYRDKYYEPEVVSDETW